MTAPSFPSSNSQIILQFLDGSDASILKLGKDEQGRACLQLANKSIWTWFLTRILRLESYQLSTIVHYIQDNRESFDQLALPTGKKIEDFYTLLNGKVSRYNLSWHKQQPIQMIFMRIIPPSPSILTPSHESKDIDEKEGYEADSANEDALETPIQLDPSTGLGLSTPLSEPSPFSWSTVDCPKHRLLIFYMNQQARLEDFKSRLASQPTSVYLGKKILEIENTDLKRVEAFLTAHYGKAPNLKDMACHLGRSLVSTRGILLGQTYQKALTDKPEALIGILKLLKSPQGKSCQAVWDYLSQLKNPSITLTALADALKISHQETVSLLFQLLSLASEDPVLSSKVQQYEHQLDEAVCQTLKISTEEMQKWFLDLEAEPKLEQRLTQLGNESLELMDEGCLTDLLDSFLQEFEEYSEQFNQPFHLIKFQNILSYLEKKPSLFPKVDQWKACIHRYMIVILNQMNRQQQQSLTLLTDYWEGLDSVRKHLNETCYNQIPDQLDKLLNLKVGSLSSKVHYLQSQALELASTLSRHLNGLGTAHALSSDEFENILQLIPLSIREVFIQIVALEAKGNCIHSLMETLQSQLGNQGNANSEQLKQYFKKVLERDGYIKYEGRTLKLVRNRRIQGRSQIMDFTPAELMQSTSVRNLSSLIKTPLPNTGENAVIQIDRYDALMEGTKRALKLIINKLEKIYDRQTKRLEALRQKKPVIIPQYYHATDLEAALSITQTSIEAIESTSGFGAFISTQPEFRYGHICFGLPKTVEFSSDIHTFINKQMAPEIITDDDVVWAGLEEFITIHSQLSIVKQEFMDSLQLVIRPRLFEAVALLGAETAYQLEARILAHFNKCAVFRAEKLVGNRLKWNLHYRKLGENGTPSGQPIAIKNDQDFLAWSKLMVEASLKGQALSRKFAFLEPLLLDALITDLAQDFKQAYQSDQTIKDFSREGKFESRIQASIIAPDDEEVLKDIYRRRRKSDRRVNETVEFKSISQIKQQFIQAGIDGNAVEFIPLTEQLIEKDLLSRVDATIPQSWQPQVDPSSGEV